MCEQCGKSSVKTYEVTVLEHRVYKTKYQVDALSKGEAEFMVHQMDDEVREGSSEFVESSGWNIVGCEPLSKEVK